MTESTVEEWAKRAARAAVDKKADDPVVLFVGGVLAITDYFVIVSGANSRQVRTIADAVEEELGRDGGPEPLRVEGLNDLTWVLIDYGDLVVHVFSTRRAVTTSSSACGVTCRASLGPTRSPFADPATGEGPATRRRRLLLWPSRERAGCARAARGRHLLRGL